MTILLIPLLSSFTLIRKNVIHFKAEDGVTITANNYFLKKTSPYILLFHQEQSSRGEYDSIAERLVKIGYNCLAVDLRSGNKYGFIENETAKIAKAEGKPVEILESLIDIRAAINYAWNLNGQDVILMGSASSASLILIEGKTSEHVRALISLSPGEYFQPMFDMKSVLKDFSKKVFVGCSAIEFPYIQEMFSDISEEYKTIFKPVDGPGARGSASLLSKNPTRDEYWLSLLIFFNSIR